MFKNLKIERFRGIKFAEIQGFKQVNLFFGNNNCGKSTLLDSLFLLTGQSNPSLSLQTNTLRGYNKIGKEDMRLNFYNLDTTQPIILSSDKDEKRSLRITTFESNSKVVDLGGLNPALSNAGDSFHGLKLEYGNNYHSEIIINDNVEKQNNSKITIDKRYKENLYAEYMPSHYNLGTSLKGLSNIINNKDESILIDSLKIFDNRIKDLQIIDGDIIIDIGLETRVPINIMGDGVRKILAIIAGVYSCSNGVILIDEIDNGIHYSKLLNVWTLIQRLAKNVNCQIFATTHSIDSIRYFAESLILNEKQKNIDNGGAFVLLHTEDNELKAIPYTMEQLLYLIKQGEEVR